MSNHTLTCIMLALLTKRRVQPQHAIDQSKHLTSEELEQLIEVLQPDASRNAIYIQLLLETGVRSTEALNLRKADVYHSSKSIFITGLKGSNSRQLPLSAALFTKLVNYMSQLETDQLFPFSYETARRIWCYYRPVKKSMRSARHAFAIDLYKDTKDIRLVQKGLGHVSISSTQVYADYVYTADEFRKAMGKRWRKCAKKAS